MVIVDSEFRERGRGRGGCGKSYADFCGQATIHDFKELTPVIDVFGDTAIATYPFEITFEMSGETFGEAGRDLFVLVREDRKWWVAWRAMLPAPNEG
jgi:hypothetical protein